MAPSYQKENCSCLTRPFPQTELDILLVIYQSSVIIPNWRRGGHDFPLGIDTGWCAVIQLLLWMLLWNLIIVS